MVDYNGTYATPRADLGEALIEYRREDGGGFIAEKVLPTLSVPKKTATFSAFTRASLLLSGDDKRAARGKYNRVDGQAADHTYLCVGRGMEIAVDDTERQFFSNDFDADFMATIMLQGRMRRAREIRTAALIFSETSFNTNFTDNSASDPWTNTSADIVGQVLDAKEKSRRLTGMNPNTMVINRPTFNLLKKNQDIKARRNVTVVLTEQEQQDSMKEIFGVDQFLIADEVYNAAAEGAAASVTDIWDAKHCWVGYCAKPGAPLAEPSVGRLIEWDIMADMLMTSYRDERIRSDILRMEHYSTEFLYDQAYATLIKIKP